MDILNDCENIFLEFAKFSSDIIDLGDPIKDDRLEQFEKIIQYKLPVDFKCFLKSYNGFSLMGTSVYGLDPKNKESSLDRIYDFEHYQVENKMPKQLLPFSNDGQGNHYCLDLNTINTLQVCKVLFWQWDFKYESYEDIEICNDSFYEWVLEEMIEWTLEEYNYDGSPR